LIDDLALKDRSNFFVTLGKETSGLRQAQGLFDFACRLILIFFLLPLYLLPLYLLPFYLQRLYFEPFYQRLTPIKRHVPPLDGAGSTPLQDCGTSRRSDGSAMQLDRQISNTSDKVRCNPDGLANHFHALKAFQDFFPKDAQLHFR